MYFAPITQMSNYVPVDKHAAIYRVYTEECFNVHLGQNWDIHWHNGNHTPTEQQYNQMILNKTGVLPRMCIRMIGELVDGVS